MFFFLQIFPKANEISCDLKKTHTIFSSPWLIIFDHFKLISTTAGNLITKQRRKKTPVCPLMAQHRGLLGFISHFEQFYATCWVRNYLDAVS